MDRAQSFLCIMFRVLVDHVQGLVWIMFRAVCASCSEFLFDTSRTVSSFVWFGGIVSV